MNTVLKQRNRGGFTIVELLIVIVVIAILAAIGIIAYSGIQQRANNSAIVNAASQSVKVIRAYMALHDEYSSTSTSNICITTVSGCVRDTGAVESANGSFDTNIATIGAIPRSIPKSGSLGNGIMYSYLSTRVYNEQIRPIMIFYWLNGTAQKCGLDNATTDWYTGVASPTGYTSSNLTIGKTLCFISI